MKTQRTLVLILLLVWTGLCQAAAQGTAFTYQGQLIANGGLAKGSYDLRFAIFDSAGATNQIGSALTNLATPVSAGLFMVSLDFGTGVFTGPARWLEVGVRSNATGNFTTLNPLQLVSAAPYAIAAGNLLGALPASQLPSTVVTNNQANLNLSGNISGNISGNGRGLTNTPGTVVWQAPSAAILQAQANAAYLLTNTQLVTLTLPASPNVGDVVQVAGVGSGGWLLAQNPGQSIAGSFTPLWAGIGAPSAKWAAIASSFDGTKLAAVVYFGGIYTSTNSGTNWRQQISAPYTNWQSIASSSDGTKLAAVVYPGGIYTSSNSGTNWTQQPSAPNQAWQSIVSSSDGTKLAAVVEFGGVYTSSNSGTNWTEQTTAPSQEWQSIASSSDGTQLAAAVYFGGIYTSSNSGTNWTQQTTAPSQEWQSIASSSDGTKLAAVVYPGDIYTSSDSGTNWAQQNNAPSGDWQSVASSSDGTQLAAVVNLGGIYTSSNSGTNWTQQTSAPNQDWQSIASSSEGTKLAATVYPGGIYTSSDSATTWTLQAGTPLASSSSGTAVGPTGFLQGAAGTSIQLIYAGGGNFVVVSLLGTIYDH
jgi:hypothetical protein